MSNRPQGNGNFEELFGVQTPDTSGVETTEAKRKRAKRISVSKTLGFTAFGVTCVIGVGTAVSAGVYASTISDRLAIHRVTETDVVDAGTATIEEVDMKMPPITLATAETSVDEVKVSFEQKLTGLLNISLGEKMIERTANVETYITVDPGKVTIQYDQENDQLTFDASETALSTKVDIPNGESETVDGEGSLALLPAEVLTQLSEAIDGTFGTDNSKVPIVNQIADGTLSIEEGLEDYADFTIVTQVDTECTPLIPTAVPNFDEQLADNLKTATKGRIFDSPELLSLLSEMPIEEISELIEDAEVILPENFEIGPDEENIAKLEAYKKGEFFKSATDTEKSIECGVVKDPTLKLIDEEN